MTCKNCGTELPNGMRFCTSCGTPVAEEPAIAPQTPGMPPQMGFQPVPPVSPQPPVKKKGGIKIPCILGMISGAASFFAGIGVFGMSCGSYEANRSYGGDAYTGMQNASAQAANNIQDTNEMLQTGMGAFLCVFGVALISYFWIKLKESKSDLRY